MIFISHRGCIRGPNPELENRPTYIEAALKDGYDVEIDVRYIDGKWWLGHDKSLYNVPFNYLLNDKLWLHCKNVEALEILSQDTRAHSFWHQRDFYTLTSKNYIWAYPNKIASSERAICVMPEQHQTNVSSFGGVCSDFISIYRDQYGSAKKD